MCKPTEFSSNENRHNSPAPPTSFPSAGQAGASASSWLFAIKALATLLFAASICATVLAQSDDVAKYIGRQTPPQVIDGTAELVGHYDPQQKLRLVLGVKVPHLAEEEQFLANVHNPDSPEFHHFLTAEEWNARFAPSPEDEQKVVDWAISQGLTVTNRYPNRLIVDVEGTSGAIEKAFAVTINRYQVESDVEFSNDREPAVPESLSGVLSGVLGLNSIQRVHSRMMDSNEAKTPDYSPGPVSLEGPSGQSDGDGSYRPHPEFSLEPEITNNLYDPTNIYSDEAYDYNALQNLGHCCNPNKNPGTSPPDSSIALASFGVFDPSDLDGFQKQYPYLATKWNIIYIDGTIKCCSDEATLDVEWSTATSNSFGSSADTAHIFMYVAANNLVSTYTDMQNTMISDDHAHVMSTSFGGAEIYGWSTTAINIVHPVFNQMSGMGWTLVAAAGDGGASDDCRHDSIDYPASDPTFVAAGGTTLALTNPGGNYVSEVAWQGNTTKNSCATNHGGTGGGGSVVFSQPGYQKGVGGSHRHIPDIALNANAGQNYYFNGKLSGVGGTSIVAPELAGFFAQENSYLRVLQNIIGSHCGGADNSPCVPVGNPNPMIYKAGLHPDSVDHYPFYDITKDCNSNDITIKYDLNFYCAGKGYDLTAGWGSANMLQLAWAINTWLAWDGGGPKATFTGPKTNAWYHKSEVIDWKLEDTTTTSYPKNGVAGYTADWDKDPGDVYSEPTPGGGNSFYSGPHHAGSTGSANLDSRSQGCHTLNLRAWDNAGTVSGDMKYGPLCYDTKAPSTTIATKSNPTNASITVTLTASDLGSQTGTGSGVARIYYSVNSSACTSSATSKCKVYSSPFTLTTAGTDVVRYFSEDKAGNFSTEKSDSITVP